MSTAINIHGTTSPVELTEIIKNCFSIQRPAFIWGPPGIGKSDLIRQIGEETGRAVIDIRLILMEPTDIKGIPYYDPIAETMKWSVSEELPKSGIGLDNCILFFDELNSAPQSVQGAAYQLILDRKIGGHYELPDECVIIAAGNRMSDRGVTYQMPSPLANRFMHFEMEANLKDWAKWAVNNGVDQRVVAYLNARPSALFQFKPASKESAFATPRSWKFASDVMKMGLGEVIMAKMVAGCIGSATALEVIEFARLAHKLPNADDILSGKVVDLDESLEMDSHYMLATNLCYRINEINKKEGKSEKVDKVMNNFLSYSMENFSAEMTIFATKMLFQDMNVQFEPSGKSDVWKTFTKKYMKFLV